MRVFPDYYTDFRCIAGRCKHNCCISWEIDIDEETAAYYKTVGGEIGARLRENIAEDGVPHFVLSENERCPFLNKDNLCDIILSLGEEHLCSICTEHPRFYNALPDRVEVGIGLACEEAARIILGKETPMRLVGAPETEDEILLLRDRAIAVLQNREKPIDTRVQEMLDLCDTHFPAKPLSAWAEILLDLERLDKAWTAHLVRLQRGRPDFAAFDKHMQGRETEYEQLLVYLIYRHFANAPDLAQAAARAAFAALGYSLLRALGALQFAAEGNFTFADMVELARLFSSEIEYSDENIYILLDELV